MVRRRYKKRPKFNPYKAIAIASCLFVLGVIAACVSSKYSGTGSTFRKDDASVSSKYHFKDLNGQQLEAATKYGIKPIERRSEVRRKARKLNKITSNKYYLLDPMTHSSPYLTDGAKQLLKTIGKRFQKKLKKAGYRQHRIIATSMLRTREDVASLRKVNGNASSNSSHMYGTTFDLSYTRYNRISTKGEPVNNDVMANLLGEVIYELREDGKCWVIFERNQHCFHITVRKK